MISHGMETVYSLGIKKTCDHEIHDHSFSFRGTDICFLKLEYVS